jgi:hypothetical protein
VLRSSSDSTQSSAADAVPTNRGNLSYFCPLPRADVVVLVTNFDAEIQYETTTSWYCYHEWKQKITSHERDHFTKKRTVNAFNFAPHKDFAQFPARSVVSLGEFGKKKK